MKNLLAAYPLIVVVLSFVVFGVAFLAYVGSVSPARGQDDWEFRTAIVLTDFAYPGPATATPIEWDGYPMATATQIPTDTPEPTPTPTATPTPEHQVYVPVLYKNQ